MSKPTKWIAWQRAKEQDWILVSEDGETEADALAAARALGLAIGDMQAEGPGLTFRAFLEEVYVYQDSDAGRIAPRGGVVRGCTYPTEADALAAARALGLAIGDMQAEGPGLTFRDFLEEVRYAARREGASGRAARSLYEDLTQPLREAYQEHVQRLRRILGDALTAQRENDYRVGFGDGAERAILLLRKVRAQTEDSELKRADAVIERLTREREEAQRLSNRWIEACLMSAGTLVVEFDPMNPEAYMYAQTRYVLSLIEALAEARKDSELLDYLDSKREPLTEMDSNGDEELVANQWGITWTSMDVRSALRLEREATRRSTTPEPTDGPF